jgi:excisionase family DNA binding protein
MLTVQQVKEKLSVNEQTVYKWIREGKLKATKFGGGERPRVRISEEQLNEFMST